MVGRGRPETSCPVNKGHQRCHAVSPVCIRRCGWWWSVLMALNLSICKGQTEKRTPDGVQQGAYTHTYTCTYTRAGRER